METASYVQAIQEDLAATAGQAGLHLRFEGLVRIARDAGGHVAPDGGYAAEGAIKQTGGNSFAHEDLMRTTTMAAS